MQLSGLGRFRVEVLGCLGCRVQGSVGVYAGFGFRVSAGLWKFKV